MFAPLREKNKRIGSPKKMAIILWWLWQWINDQAVGKGIMPLSLWLDFIIRSVDENRLAWEG